MVDVVAFAALGWEGRLVLDALGGVEPSGPRRWTGFLGDGSSCMVVQTGVGFERATAAAEAAPNARLFVGTGCAGGLDPRLVSGDVVVGTHVLDASRPGTRYATVGEPLVAWASGRGQVVASGIVVSSPQVVGGVEAKAATARSGGRVVDMESAALARVAQRRGIPFVAIRAVLDPAAGPAPVGLDAIDPVTGDLRMARAIASIATRPRQWATTVRLARQKAAVERRLRPLLAVLFGGGLDAFGIEIQPASGAGAH